MGTQFLTKIGNRDRLAGLKRRDTRTFTELVL